MFAWVSKDYERNLTEIAQRTDLGFWRQLGKSLHKQYKKCCVLAKLCSVFIMLEIYMYSLKKKHLIKKKLFSFIAYL